MVGHGVNLRIVPQGGGGTRAGKATVTKQDVVLPSLTEEERAAVASEGGGLGLLGPTRRVCLVCKARASSYSCPRCATPYCSAACYKGHNTGCTEGFYRRHVEEGMQLRDADSREQGEGRRATIEALRRVRLEGEGTGDDWLAAAVSGRGAAEGEEEEVEEEEGGGIMGEERLAELAALAEAGELDVGALTPEEQKAFMRVVASGELGRGLRVWRAFWEGPPALSEATGAPLLVAVEEEEEEVGEERPVDLPSLWRALEQWRRAQQQQQQQPAPAATAAAASSPSPSPLLRYHLLDALFAYAAVLRTYNGQWRSDPPQAADDLLALSGVLSAAAGSGSDKEKEQRKKGMGKASSAAPTPPAPAATPAAPLPESAAGALAASLAALRRWDGAVVAVASADGRKEASPALAMGLALARDVSSLLSHGTLGACALLDAYSLVRAALGEMLEEGAGGGDGDLAALASRLEAALGGGAAKGGGKEAAEEKTRRRQRRQEGRRLLRALHKLRFLLAWVERQQPVEAFGASGASSSSWLLRLRAEWLVAVQEHEAVVVAGGGGGGGRR